MIFFFRIRIGYKKIKKKIMNIKFQKIYCNKDKPSLLIEYFENCNKH